jgi:hypothetical protein
MTTRSWDGGTGDWYNALLWSTTLGDTGVFVSGDTVLINSGTVDVSGAEETAIGVGLDAVQVTLGAATIFDPAVIAATGARFGQAFTIVSDATAPYAAFDTTGPSGLSGTILASAAGGAFTIDATTAADGAQPASFVLLHGGLIDVSGGDDLILNGSMVTDSNVTIAAGSTFTNNGIDRVFGGVTYIAPTATLTGTGTFEAAPGATLEFESPVPATQTVTFGTAGRLNLTSPSTFAGTISSFILSDTIDLLNIVANSATYDLGSGLLAIEDSGSLVATIAMQGPTSNVLLHTSSDGAGGTLITYPGSASRTSYEIDVADQSVQANVVRQTMRTAAGAPINGAGITIGIMSDSFNATLNGVVDPADTAAALGYLPETGGGTSAVTILKDSTQSGVANEGLAMAELVHQIAPGAAIDFYTAEGGQENFAQGVTALVQAGANIIVDDWSFSDTPFYQVAGPVDTAVENAVSAGVEYFTAASNFGDAYYESAWQPTTAQLVLQAGQPAQNVMAQQFGDGTPLQTITIPGSLATTIELQWNAAWPAPGGSASDPIVMALYTAGGSLVKTSSQVFDTTSGYGPLPEIQLSIPVTQAATQYELAIYQTGTAAVSQFKYVLFGTPGTAVVGSATVADGSTVSAQDPGGVIDDPAAGQGTGDVHGQELVPGANTVGAAYWATSPAFGVSPDWTEYFSSLGPGTLLFDQNGDPLTPPQSGGKVDFVAPDGIQTSIPGFQAFFGTSAAAPDAAAVAALMLQANPSLTTSQVTSLLQQSALNMDLPAADQGAGLIQAPEAVELAQALCFLRGTLVGAPAGEVPVERLSAGDTVLTLCGGTRRIVWIGQGRMLATRGRRGPATPVIVRQGALGPGVPYRDLHVTKGHALYIDGVLIPVEFLVNHRSIIWDDHAQEVTLYHVELDAHDALKANGALAESYRDDGNRWLFQNANTGWGLPPQQPFAPVLTGGPIVDAVWLRLLHRTGPRPGLSMTHDPDLHLLVDGRRMDVAQRVGEAHVFNLPDRPGTVRILSRAVVPQEAGLARDARSLGVALRNIAVRRGARFQIIKANDPRLAAGFHAFEPDTRLRWTNGNAALPAAAFDSWSGPIEVVLTVGGTTHYIEDGARRLVA